MIDGTLEVKDLLPEAWSEQMQTLLGITPDSGANGCMQDIHSPDGSFGYFPTYTLGAMIGAQLFNKAQSAIGHLSTLIQQGEFAHLYSWLSHNVHALGSKFPSPDLLRHATGESLNTSYYKEHLKRRYG